MNFPHTKNPIMSFLMRLVLCTRLLTRCIDEGAVSSRTRHNGEKTQYLAIISVYSRCFDPSPMKTDLCIILWLGPCLWARIPSSIITPIAWKTIGRLTTLLTQAPDEPFIRSRFFLYSSSPAALSLQLAISMARTCME